MKQQPDTSIRVPQRDKIRGVLNLKPLAWTEKQKQFIELAENKETKIIFISGPAGSTKTLLATFVALEMLNAKKVSDILYIRSAVESSDSKLGYLPGEIDEKFHVYGVPFLEKLDELLPKSEVQNLISDNRVSIMPVNFTRGLNWNAKCILIDEAQNFTFKELVTVLTRIGKFSKCFVLADPMQSDINGKSGAFEKMSQLFNDTEAQRQGIHYWEFTEEDIMRSDLVKFLVKRFNLVKQLECAKNVTSIRALDKS